MLFVLVFYVLRCLELQINFFSWYWSGRFGHPAFPAVSFLSAGIVKFRKTSSLTMYGSGFVFILCLVGASLAQDEFEDSGSRKCRNYCRQLCSCQTSAIILFTPLTLSELKFRISRIFPVFNLSIISPSSSQFSSFSSDCEFDAILRSHMRCTIAYLTYF